MTQMEIEGMEQQTISSKQWVKRITLHISPGQMKRLKKDKAGLVVLDGQMYEIKPKKQEEALMLADGRKLTRAMLLKLLNNKKV